MKNPFLFCRMLFIALIGAVPTLSKTSPAYSRSLLRILYIFLYLRIKTQATIHVSQSSQAPWQDTTSFKFISFQMHCIRVFVHVQYIAYSNISEAQRPYRSRRPSPPPEKAWPRKAHGTAQSPILRNDHFTRCTFGALVSPIYITLSFGTYNTTMA